MSIDLSVTNKPAVQKKAEEEPDNREQIRDFVQKAAPQKAERARKKHAPVQRKMCSFMIPVPLLEELDRFLRKESADPLRHHQSRDREDPRRRTLILLFHPSAHES